MLTMRVSSQYTSNFWIQPPGKFQSITVQTELLDWTPLYGQQKSMEYSWFYHCSTTGTTWEVSIPIATTSDAMPQRFGPTQVLKRRTKSTSPSCEPEILTNWARDTSAYIKSLDPTRRVSLGDEGWLCGGGDGSYTYSCTSGIDFEANLAIPTLGYGTFHMYPDGWGYEYSWGNDWIEQHALLAD